MTKPSTESLQRRIRYLTCLLIVGLVASGATAIPLQWELDTTASVLSVAGSASEPGTTGLAQWITRLDIHTPGTC